MNVVCHYCKRPVDVESTTVVRAVWGWQTTRFQHARQNGGSDIIRRQPFDRYAHYACVLKERAGVNAGQESLL